MHELLKKFPRSTIKMKFCKFAWIDYSRFTQYLNGTNRSLATPQYLYYINWKWNEFMALDSTVKLIEDMQYKKSIK